MLSVVVPVYDEEDALPIFVDRVRPLLDGLGRTYEVLAVDDGSTDRTPALLERYRRGWPQLRVVRLRANSGHQAALTAGLVRARGDWVVSIDADLQDPPEAIGEMLATAERECVDVVYGVRADRSTDTRFKRHTASFFYALMRRMTSTSAPAHAGDFRLMSRATVDAVNLLPEQHRVFRLAIPALGFPSASVTYDRAPRAAGRTKYSLVRMMRLSLDSLTGFSAVPLRLATWSGFAGFVVAGLLGVFGLVAWLVGHTLPGWTSIFAVVVGAGALQLFCLGLLGEYVGRIYTTVLGRPAYFIAYDSLEHGDAGGAVLEPVSAELVDADVT